MEGLYRKEGGAEGLSGRKKKKMVFSSGHLLRERECKGFITQIDSCWRWGGGGGEGPDYFIDAEITFLEKIIRTSR